MKYSRPLYGVSYLNSERRKMNEDMNMHSRPLYGVSYLNQTTVFERMDFIILVPSTGSLISIHSCKIQNGVVSILVPSTGSLISILSPTPPKTQGFHPPFAGQTRK